ncbi:uncharacterized protein LOC128675383 [Plodia interpunctella]|uniref:uncharacterized protein LOC128675383 n=1 Tax=Plodia interpunctella TaxID=58824 RepID=UPI002367BB3F|nr:uncharacterized protein LOC128675383 [Plodia interpunctella]
MFKILYYALKQCDLPTMVSSTSRLLRILSLNLDPLYEKKIPAIFYIITVIMFSSYVYVYVFSMAWFIFWKCPQTGDVTSAMVVFSLGMSSEISTVKFIYMFIYQDTLRHTMSEYLSYDSKADPNSKSTRRILEILNRVKTAAVTFWCIVMGNGLVYCTKPLLMSGRHLMEDTEFLYGLEPLFMSPNYEIGYILSLNACIFTVYATANISAFFIVATGYIEAQMLSLSEELVNIWDDANYYFHQTNNITVDIFIDLTEEERKDKDSIINKYVKEKLRTIIHKHSTNIYFLNKIEYVFRNCIAIEFALLIISLIAEFLGGIENTYILMPFALVQVTMDCITGQKLLDSSDIFQRAVYDCKWENFDVTNMKTVLMILVNSQKGLTLTVGGLKNLCYICLMDVFRLIYSTYTALQSTLND